MTLALRHLKRFLSMVQTGWSIVGITLVVLILTEAGFRAAFALKDWFGIDPSPDRRVLEGGYGGQTWPVHHYRELQALADHWEPYVYFRQNSFAGQTISIEPDGRATWRPPPPAPGSRPERKPIELLMLGGSSLWGFGARDDQTIPSLLARELFEQGWDVRIRNRAEIGYVSTQEMVALVRELQAGYRPDLVVFYDGVNDTTSAYLQRSAGLTTNEENREKEFNLLQSPARLAGALITDLIGKSGSYRFAQAVRRRFDRDAGVPSLKLGQRQLGLIGGGVLSVYEANVSIVEALGREFGFRPLFYWQPVVFDKPALVPFEREEALRYAWCEWMFRDVYGGLRTAQAFQGLRKDPAFHDLSGIFAESKDLVFIDYCHTTEAANARIVAAIAQDVVALLRSTPGRDGKPRDGGGGPDRPGVK
jgi:lysophospholipase L1-like esterase